MAQEGRIRISGIRVKALSDRVRELYDTVNDPDVREDLNYILGQAINKYVPIGNAEQDGDSHVGALRKSMRATKTGIVWDAPYAHYQWVGEVYEANIPVWRNNRLVGWASSAEKVPSGRYLGTPGYLINQRTGEVEWVFGYTDPMTDSEWGIDSLPEREYNTAIQVFANRLRRRLNRGNDNG